ncbi:MAG: hypothetical protein M1836_005065 [Candelina mexicana]|nr:MAG: hypothetical protein M1836_005065 [Candelina mexicana]
MSRAKFRKTSWNASDAIDTSHADNRDPDTEDRLHGVKTPIQHQANTRKVISARPALYGAHERRLNDLELRMDKLELRMAHWQRKSAQISEMISQTAEVLSKPESREPRLDNIRRSFMEAYRRKTGRSAAPYVGPGAPGDEFVHGSDPGWDAELVDGEEDVDLYEELYGISPADIVKYKGCDLALDVFKFHGTLQSETVQRKPGDPYISPIFKQHFQDIRCIMDRIINSELRLSMEFRKTGELQTKFNLLETEYEQQMERAKLHSKFL